LLVLAGAGAARWWWLVGCIATRKANGPFPWWRYLFVPCYLLYVLTDHCANTGTGGSTRLVQGGECFATGRSHQRHESGGFYGACR